MAVDGVGSLSALRSLAANATQVSEERIAAFVREQGETGDITVHFTNGSLAAGASGGTLMFDLRRAADGQADIEECVLRFDLGNDGIFSQVSLKDQFDIMQALGRRGLTVPAVRWLDVDGRIVDGADALVMDRITALTPTIQYLQMGPYADASVTERAKMLAELMRFASALHEIPAADLGVPSLYARGGEGEYFIDREIIEEFIQQLRDRGVTFRLGSPVVSVTREGEVGEHRGHSGRARVATASRLGVTSTA